MPRLDLPKPSCLFICTLSPLDESYKSGGVNLTRANYFALSHLFSLDVANSLSGPATILTKIFRVISAVFGSLAGNSYFFRQSILRKLKAHHYDFVFIDHSQLGSLAQLVRQASPGTKIVGAFQNIESEYVVKSMNLPPVLRTVFKNAAFKNEKTLAGYSDYLLCLTHEDSEGLKDIYGRGADLTIPITTAIPEVSTRVPPPIQGPYILFCGSYFKPNIDGLTWFVDNVLSEIKLPLVVVGFQMENLKGVIVHPQLVIIGTVDDLSHYYWEATAVVNPVFMGAGMNSKSVEAISFGKPLYATSFAIRGFPAPLPSKIIICNSSEEFIAKLGNLSLTTEPYQDLISYYKASFTLTQRIQAFSKVFLGVEGLR